MKLSSLNRANLPWCRPASIGGMYLDERRTPVNSNKPDNLNRLCVESE